ncbi:MAG: flagellar hook-basal body protein [Dehalococcoidia bacterium]|jgi:flagellar basal-body rod protein FlgG|nr:flagellar hook-basal body protein [Dehalococcoidia bacterium]
MLQGIYTAASGMLAHEAMSEVISNNLANASTPGFRQDFATFHMAGDKADAKGRSALSPMLVFRSYTDFELGSIRTTGNPLDLSLADDGNGFFTVETPEGERYTRAGNFTLSPSGTIVTQNSLPVLGTAGPITANGGEIEITNTGEVYVDKNYVDRLKIVRFDRVDGRVPLRKAGHSLLTPLDDQTIPRVATDPQVRQQTLEGSNVNMVQEMAKLIHMVRGYEAYQRAILVSDNSLNMLIQRVGGGN